MGAVFGRYEALSPISSGGMASVHLARTQGVGGFERLVAIKVMHPDIARDPAFVAMFLDEGRLAARVRHPNVVGTIDVQEGPEGLFLVMEYVEGPSLGAMFRALERRRERMPVGVALRILIDALQGLHAAHEQTGPTGEPLHIVHRDVSPQNVLVGVDGHAKITDFGVARAEARLASTEDGSVKGKIAYMPPQQIRGEKVDRRADVYGAGVVLWEALAGERLFAADNAGAVIFAALAGPRCAPAEVCPDVPAAIDRACMKALATEPEDRHATALAFAAALEQAAQEAGVAIASAWQVGAYVTELGAHRPASAVLAERAPIAAAVANEKAPIAVHAQAPAAAGHAEAVLARASADAGHTDVAVRAAAAVHAQVSLVSPRAGAPAAVLANEGETQSQVASVVTTTPTMNASGGRRAGAAIVVAIVCAGLGIAAFASREGPASEANSSAQERAGAAASPEVSVTPKGAVTPSIAAEAPSIAAEAPSIASASTTSSAAARATSSPSRPARTTTTASAKARPKDDWRPPGL